MTQARERRNIKHNTWGQKTHTTEVYVAQNVKSEHVAMLSDLVLWSQIWDKMKNPENPVLFLFLSFFLGWSWDFLKNLKNCV